jgi:hypothetical protein
MRALFADGPFDGRVKKAPFHERKSPTRRKDFATMELGL